MLRSVTRAVRERKPSQLAPAMGARDLITGLQRPGQPECGDPFPESAGRPWRAPGVDPEQRIDRLNLNVEPPLHQRQRAPGTDDDTAVIASRPYDDIRDAAAEGMPVRPRLPSVFRFQPPVAVGRPARRQFARLHSSALRNHSNRRLASTRRLGEHDIQE